MAFNTWRDVALSMYEQQMLLNGAVFRMRSMGLSRAFNSWRSDTFLWFASEVKVAQGARAFIGTRLFEAFRNWREYTALLWTTDSMAAALVCWRRAAFSRSEEQWMALEASFQLELSRLQHYLLYWLHRSQQATHFEHWRELACQDLVAMQQHMHAAASWEWRYLRASFSQWANSRHRTWKTWDPPQWQQEPGKDHESDGFQFNIPQVAVRKPEQGTSVNNHYAVVLLWM